MNQETIKLLETIAAKLGVTADMLWAALIKQAPISSTIDTILILLYFVIVGLVHRMIRRADVSKFDDDESARTVVLGCYWIVFGIAGFFLITQAPLVIAGWFNPEYWALKQLTK